MKPAASVIIPTRNRAAVLEGCLLSLTEQSTSNFEVLVIDNGSDDDTSQVAETFRTRLRLRCIQEAEPGLHNARHAGMHEARSEILMFCDDDILAGTTWVESVVACFDDEAVAMVGGNNYPVFASPPPLWLQEAWSQPVYRGKALSYLSILDFGDGRFDIDPGFIWGCNFSIRRKDLLRAGGFHPDALPDDLVRYRGDGETHVADRVRATGRRALFDSGASVRHRVGSERMTAGYFRKRAFAQGISDSYTAVRRRGATSLAVPEALKGLYCLLRAKAANGRSSDWNALRFQIAAAHADGYRFHQRHARKDKELLEWIQKDHYMGNRDDRTH